MHQFHFSQRVVVRPDDYEWRDSPASGGNAVGCVGDGGARHNDREFAPGSL